MIAYLGFIFVVIVLISYSNYLRTKAFDDMKIYRTVTKDKLQVGEEFYLNNIVENRKRLSVPFLNIKQNFPKEIINPSGKNQADIFMNIKGFEKANSRIKLKVEKRGVYLLKDMKISVGDMLGFNIETKEIEDFIEIVAYPKLITFSSYNVINNNLQGDNIIKRWIFKDPLYIKGLREYNVEDRMKDIHWASSLRQNKLMVKEYDSTTEKEIVFIINAQSGVPFYRFGDAETIEFGISLCLSMIKSSIESGIATGLWTNAYIASFSGAFPNKIEPQNNSFEHILQLAGRMSLPPKNSFNDFLSENIPNFKPNRVYVIIASFIEAESIGILVKLKNLGISIKFMDISAKGDLEEINGIEKIIVKERASNGST